MLVIYSHWVRIVTAKTTNPYITSIMKGWDSIAGQLEIYQTPWFNFIDIQGQQRVLLCVLEAIELQNIIRRPRTFSMDILDVQRLGSPKRKLDNGEYYNKRRKGGTLG